jgi:hypothetical protein
MTRIDRIVACVALCAAALVLPAVGDAGAATLCQDEFIGAEQAGSGAQLQDATEALWEEAVEHKYGTAWAQWDSAANQRFSCSWSQGGADFVCTARARPCLAETGS